MLTTVLNAADLMLAVVFNTANSLETFDDVTIRGKTRATSASSPLSLICTGNLTTHFLSYNTIQYTQYMNKNNKSRGLLVK